MSLCIYTFLNMKRDIVFNQEISRNLILIKRYQEKRDRGSRENKERKKERDEHEYVREKEGEREKEIERESVGLHIIISTRAIDIVKAESSGEDPKATGGLVSNLPHPRVIKTKQH